MITDDGIKVTTLVEVDPDDAFRIFTEEIDLWWRRGPAFRGSMDQGGEMRFEPGREGRLVERDSQGNDFELGRVLAWEPGARLSFEWRNRNFAEGEITEVDIRFEPSPSGTKVTLEHRGWLALREDHPARHGLDAIGVTRMIGNWWVDVLTGLRRHVVPPH